MPQPSSRPPSTAAGNDRWTVLVVEDNVDAQFITSSILCHVGYDVMKAGSVDEAHRLAEKRRPDLVLLDCALPDGDGLELAQRWRKDLAMSAVPIIVLTAFSARQDVEAALLAGADAFLVKPCTNEALLAQVKRLIGSEIARPSQGMRASSPSRPA